LTDLAPACYAMDMRTLIRLCLFAVLTTPALALAEDVTEPGTGHAFPAERSYNGKSYNLVGVGLRKKFIIKVYAMGLYAEQEGGKSAFAASSDHGQGFFTRGDFDKLAVLHFAREVDSGKIREAYRESMGDELAAGGERQKAAEAFLALFDRDVKKGEDLVIHTTSDGQVTVEVGGQKKTGPMSKQLATAIWNIWLGARPPSPDMRTTLIQRISVLGK
jgi:hypothetical protein